MKQAFLKIATLVSLAGVLFSITIIHAQEPTESVVGTQNNDINSITELAIDNSNVCDPSQDGNFEWHGKCKQCPADYEAILYPFLVLFLLILFIVLLQYLLPSCFTALYWWGLEYIQMLYLIGFLPTIWSPIANTIFEKFLPLFALDLNASFSVQCVMGDDWQKEDDMILIILLPFIALIVLTLLSKISKGRIIRDKSVSRLIVIMINVGYLKLVLSSLEVLEFPASWSTDDLSFWVSSDPFYSTLLGITGLLIYGLIFPFWFLQKLRKYYRLARDDAERNEPIGQDVENGAKRIKRSLIKKQAKKKKEIFMTLGVFPTTLRPVAWWWPGLLMCRKLMLAVLLVIFKDSLFLLLVIFLVTHLSSFIVQQCRMPHFKESSRKWYHAGTVDTVLQLCLIVIVGVVCLSCWSINENMMSDFFQKWTEVILVCIFIPSLIYLCLAIGISCAHAEPRFEATASNIVKKKIAAKRGFNSAGDGSISTQTASSQGSSNEASDVDTAEWKQPADDDDWIRKGPSSVKEEGYDDEELFVNGRADSTTDVATNDLDIDIEAFVDDDDMGTIIEEHDDMGTIIQEIWMDEDTGEEILDPKNGNWMDAETGLRAIPLDN
mmetsp:Transcript_18032/g.20837  ORF Transcript_18032/g.20837 Transcript_18032/m.20837 type:complete len:607 (+) Transcript_18032:65-1885(+)